MAVLNETLNELQVTPINEIVDGLSPEQKEFAMTIANAIDINDSKQVQNFGVSVQQKLDETTNKLLEKSMNVSTDEVNTILADFIGQLNELTPEDIEKARKKGFFPWMKKSINKRLNDVRLKAQTINGNIGDVKSKLEGHYQNQLTELQAIDDMIDHNKEYFQDLNVVIAAGQMKIDDIMENEVAKLKEEYKKTNDPMIAQQISNLMANVAVLENKLNDFQIIQMSTLQNGYELSIMKENSRILSEKLNNSINVVLPLWKKQISMSISLTKTEQALEAQELVTKATNDLILSVSEQVKNSSVAIAKVNNQNIIDIDTLKKSQENLITTAKQIVEINNNAGKNRKAVKEELQQLRSDLSNEMSNIATEKSADYYLN